LLYLRAVEELTYDEIAKEVNYDPIIVRYELQKIYATVRARIKKMSTSYSAVGLGRAIEKCERFRGLVVHDSSSTATVSNPKALARWLYKVGENHCENLHKHSKVVKRHEEFVGHTAIAGKRNSIPIALSGSSTPEEDLIEKKEAPIWEKRILDTRARVRRVLTEDIVIASRWAKGQKPQDIAVEINKSAATVYRKLAMMQKAVIEEIGLIETEENKRLIKEGLRELFANSLEGMV
jgi:DNA-directed RNA polymerase specialized sigma24 family protein